MKAIRMFSWLLALFVPVVLLSACQSYSKYDSAVVEIPQFNYPQTVEFKPNLTDYGLFQGSLANLTPADDSYLLELASPLFTDYAFKQRLVKLPVGTQIERTDDEIANFPNGTLLSKTFYYLNDVRDAEQGKRIIETRLLIKAAGIWNAATYVWNAEQNQAILQSNGLETSVKWIDAEGTAQSTQYQVPTANDCIVCHQQNNHLTPLGPTLRNLNVSVERDGEQVNQLSYLQGRSLLNDFPVEQVASMVNYKDESANLAERGRAYLAMNCAHCHRPGAWSAATERDFDFRHQVSLNNSGISYSEDKIIRAVTEGKMPFIGTTMLDHEGVKLITDYVSSVQ